MASKGNKAHKQVDLANDYYRHSGDALISYAGPQFTVTKTLQRGVFQGFMQPGPCDYLGHTREGVGIRFDLKSTSAKQGLDLGKSRKSTPRQLKELAWCWEHSPETVAGILVKRVETASDVWFWLPAWWLADKFRWSDFAQPDGGLLSWKKIESHAAGFTVPTFSAWPDRPNYLAKALDLRRE